MSDNVIQTSFNAGEWAPALNARVDLAKYHSGAALLRNFFVDYRGGATTRPGTKFILPTLSTSTVRLIPFQASFTVSYVLEFGQGYIRFFNNGAPVLETGKNITAITNANPGVITSAAHGFSNGDWVLLSGIGGTTQLNNNYYIITGAAANTFTLTDLFGNVINTTTFGVYTSGGTAQRVYTLFTSPYLSSEVFGIKYTQNVNQLYLCHPNYPPYVLTLNSATSWTMAAITFGATIGPPSGIPSNSNNAAAGGQNMAYVVTSVDANGQESTISSVSRSQNLVLVGATWTTTLSWTAVSGAVSYNVYRTIISTSTTTPAGINYGFCGNLTGTTFLDTNINPNFDLGPPIPQNPFSGSGVQSLILSNAGAGYNSVPNVTLTASPGVTAVAHCSLTAQGLAISAAGNAYNVSDTLTLPGGVTLLVVATDGFGHITGVNFISTGLLTSGSVPSNPVTQLAGPGIGASFNLTWIVTSLQLDSPGSGYLLTPTVGFVGGSPSVTAVATAVLGAASSGNPTVPGLHQQRLVLGGPVGNPQQFNMSQPGSPFNFNINEPIEADDAIQGTLTSGQLNTIQSFISMPAGLVTLSDRQAWLINGGSPGSPVSALSIAANSQAYNGSSPLPPILSGYEILYVQAKGSIVRNLSYNFYTNVYTGADISILSSHLFYSYTITQWAWAEEPFKIVWAVRNDGQLLSLTFQKEQEMIAWAHSDTLGLFKSIATVTETTSTAGAVDAIYHVVQRNIQSQAVQYVERFVELTYPQDYKSSWQVDAGIGYNGSPATTFSGAQHLGGQVVTGVADGVVINFTMPTSGTFVFGIGGTAGLTAIPNASIVTVGLAFLPQLQTLALDLGQPTVQGKRKKVSAVTVRTKQALGLATGRTFSTLVAMKDLVLGNVGTMSNTVVTGLVTSDARTIVDPQYDVFGQFCIQQSNPYPATILGVVPEIEVGDTAK